MNRVRVSGANNSSGGERALGDALLEVPPEVNLQRVADWYARLKARPAYRSAILDWFDWDISWTDLMHEEGAKVSNRVRAMVEDMRDPDFGAWTPPGAADQ